MDDHARGCEGRNYTCSCGYDGEVTDLRQLLQEHTIVIEMQRDEIQTQKELRRQDREAVSSRAREIASMYPQSSDGRNTFLIFADWIEAK